MAENDGYTLVVKDNEFSILKDGEVVSIWSPEKETFSTADGVVYVIQKPVDLHPTLDKYKVGERVDVLKHGDWVTGHITSKERGGSLIYVHTEKGPASVGSTRMIRKIL